MSGRLACFLVVSSSLFTTIAAQDRSSERFDLALGLIQRGMHDDAARQLKRFVKDHPEHAKCSEAWYRLGTCNLELKDSTGAIEAFRKALKNGPFKLRAECQYRLGHTLQKDDPNAAALTFAALVKEAGADHYLAAPSLYARGECLREMGEDKLALVAYTRAAALDKEKSGLFAASSLYQAGFIQLRRKDYAAAERVFASAADRFPKHKAYGECRFLQGEAALRGKRYEAALRAFGEAVRAGGEFADDAAMGIGHCAVADEDSHAAVKAFRRVAARFPKSNLKHKALLEAGRVLYRAKKPNDAEAQLSELLALRKVDAAVRWPALELRGLAHLDLGHPKKAVTDLTQAIALAGHAEDKARILYSLGEAFADGGDWKRAHAAYQACHATTELDALKGDALYGRCLALHRLKQFGESNNVVFAFLRDHGEHRLRVPAGFAAAENFFAMKEYGKADQTYKLIPTDHALAGKSAFKRAWCSYLGGDFKAAAGRFARLARSKSKASTPLVEESLSMEALAWLEADGLLQALKAADRYRAAFPRGTFLSRTERVAARVLKRQRKFKAAASRLAMAASVEKSGDVAMNDKLEYAELLFKQGDFAAAQRAYASLASRKDVVGGRAHEGLAWCAFELGDDKVCNDWIERGLAHKSLGKGRAGLLELKSALHHRRKEWGEAQNVAELYLRDFADHPRSNELRYSLGVARARQNKLQPARQILESLRTAEMKRSDRVFYELAWVCRRMKDEPAALAAFREVAKISKDEDMVGEARLHVGEALLAGKNPGEGLKWLEAVKGKHTPRAQYLCGFHRFEKKQYPTALGNFDRIVKRRGAELYFEAQFFAGECLFRMDKPAAAAPRFAALLSKKPNHERAQVARLHQGQCQIKIGKPRAASMVLQDYLRRAAAQKAPSSDLARANLWLGKARQSQKDYRRAELAFGRVTDLTDSELSAEAQYRIGECRIRRGQLSGAVDAFVKLSILYQHAEWVQRGLSSAGDCYVQLEMPKKAAKLYQELVNRFPKCALAKVAQTKLKNIRSMLP
jgi:TolA-binding protein